MTANQTPTIEETARETARLVEEDLRGRKGIRHEWERIDEEIQQEISEAIAAPIATALRDLQRRTRAETVEACAKLVCEVCDNPDKGGEDWSATKPLAEFGGNLGHESSDTIAITECLASALYREFGFPGEAGKENEG